MTSLPELKQQARLLLQDHRLREAKHVLETVLKSEKSDWECWYMLGTVHGMLGELVASKKCSQQVVALAPDVHEGHLNLANALLGLGRYEEAEVSFRNALKINPSQPAIYQNMGNLFLGQKNYKAAEAAYRDAIRLQPSYAEAYSNLAVVLQETNRLSEALQNHQQALQFMPANTGFIYSYACALLKAGRLAEADKTFRAVLNDQPNHAEAHDGLASVLLSLGRDEGAIEHYKAALALNPALDLAARHLRLLYGRTIPGWHFQMMNDAARNRAYDEALRKVVTPNSVVLDIGSGSGLLAMMAARAGAKHVYTCEVKKALADKAVEIIETNGYSDVITIINKKSTDMIIDEDMAEPADILVSEILDECLLGEGVIPSVYHARAGLVKKTGNVIPRSAAIYAALVESKYLHETYYVNVASDFDVSAFNEFSTAHYINLRLSSVPYQLICKPAETFYFNLADPDPRASGEEVFSVTADRDCTCHAVAFWFRLDLDAEISISTSPLDESGESHWMQALQIQNPPITLKVGQTVRVRGKYDSMSIRFGIES